MFRARAGNGGAHTGEMRQVSRESPIDSLERINHVLEGPNTIS